MWRSDVKELRKKSVKNVTCFNVYHFDWNKIKFFLYFDFLCLRKGPLWGWTTEMNRINRVHYKFLCDEAENQQMFVAIVLPSSGIVSAIYYTVYGLIRKKQQELISWLLLAANKTKIRQLDCRTYATKTSNVLA